MAVQIESAFVGVGELIGRPAHFGKGLESACLLIGRQALEDGPDLRAPDHVDLFDGLPAEVGDADGDDAPVIVGFGPLDEAVLDHALDDAGHIRQRNVELIRQPGHRHVAVADQQKQHVELGRADRPQAAGARLRDAGGR